MPDLIIRPSGPLRGAVTVPGDKSITHRALMLATIAEGDTEIAGWVPAEVCLATLRCMQALGAEIEELPSGRLLVHGRGLDGLAEPADVLHCKGSGTTIRLLSGLVAGQPFTTLLTGTDPLRRRPMGRIAEPLRLMGATVLGRDGGRLPPLAIRGGSLKGIDYTLPVASAQVKSAILLAGLFAEGETTVREPGPSRDHTERMLRAMGAGVDVNGNRVTIRPGGTLRPLDMTIPADISSAAFVLVAALLSAGGPVTISGVGVNPTRTGVLDILAAMGAPVDLAHPREEGGEPVADLVASRAAPHGADIGGDVIVRAIDEFPVLMVAATQAEGETIVRDAAEMRVKETDRLAVMTAELRKLGAAIEERPDGFRVAGPQALHGALVDGHDDHRVAMALAVAGLVAQGETVVADARCVHDSFPGFVETMQALGADMTWSSHD